MSCIPVSHSVSTILSPTESQMEESPVARRGSKAYQIFPEANVDEEADSSSYPADFLYKRERLPSIVVEPTEHTERCRYLMANNGEEEESSADHTDGSVDGEQQEDTEMEERLVARKSSIEPTQNQRALSRLTPPASPTPPEAAPPCPRS